MRDAYCVLRNLIPDPESLTTNCPPGKPPTIMIRFKPAFAGHGEVRESTPGQLVLDMGNHLLPGVIDHHQHGGAPTCTAMLVRQHPELVRDHLAGWPIAQVTFLLHRVP